MMIIMTPTNLRIAILLERDMKIFRRKTIILQGKMILYRRWLTRKWRLICSAYPQLHSILNNRNLHNKLIIIAVKKKKILIHPPAKVFINNNNNSNFRRKVKIINLQEYYRHNSNSNNNNNLSNNKMNSIFSFQKKN